MHRRLLVLRGSPDATRAEAAVRLAAFPSLTWGPPALGTDAEAVAISLHEGLDPDALGRAVGAVRGGGVLVVTLPADGPPPWAGLAVWPHAAADAGARLTDRLERSLATIPDPGPLAPRPFTPAGTPEQAAVVAALRASAPGDRHVVIGGRGRGKSTAVGLAAAALPGRTVVTSLEPAHAAALRTRAPVPWCEPLALLTRDEAPDTVIVDEAGAVPVPVLVRCVTRWPRARWIFATTVHGYEGSGRGFVHRFLPWLRARGPVHEHRLAAPVRWADDDPVERWADALLLLDAVRPPAPAGGAPRVQPVDRDALARDEATLRDLFGLLVEAHYRTTPADLARVLDGPNLSLHAARIGDRVLGVCLWAAEGGLPPDRVEALLRGERLRGHALPETLVSHLGARDAGGLRWVRSVRLATDPARRGEGLGRALVEAVEASTAPDGWGTLFGATAALLRFRRALGYLPVRLAASRGARSGEPSVVLIKPRSPAARGLLDRLRADLARDLPVQLALCAADGGAPLDDELRDLLAAGLPPPSAPDPGALAAFLRGRPYEAVAASLEPRVAAADRSGLAPADRALVEGRVLRREAWTALGPDVPASMKRLRRALAALLGP